MTAFDELERAFRAAVRREHGGRAEHSAEGANPADPAWHGAGDARPGDAARRRRPWLRPPALALGAALLVAGGALAATGTIRIGPSYDDHDPRGRPNPHHGAGLRAGPAKTLALRVADPAGGPPWTLRVFRSTRAGNCVQVGQVVRGRFGVFVPPDTLEPLRAWPGRSSSLCSGRARAGFPIVRGLQRIRLIGGATDSRRCPGRPHGDCPLTSVTLLRYGLLGPGARRVRLLDAAGRTLATMPTSPRIGGAYLFAVARPIAPYVAADRALRAPDDPYRRARRAATARGLSGVEATREARRVSGMRGRGTSVRPPALSVLATFADGRTLRVSGKGRSHAPLPGVEAPAVARAAPLPRDVPVTVRVAKPGRFTVVELSFRAPRAITRFDVRYTSTLRGPVDRACTTQSGGYQATTGDIADGQTVRLVMRRRGVRVDGRQRWCRGRFAGTIRYSTARGHVVIGRYTFRVP